MDNKNFVAHEDATFVAGAQATEGASQVSAEHQQHPGPPPDYFSEDLPPAYQVASALPTYEEAELTKGKKNHEKIRQTLLTFKLRSA